MAFSDVATQAFWLQVYQFFQLLEVWRIALMLFLLVILQLLQPNEFLFPCYRKKYQIFHKKWGQASAHTRLWCLTLCLQSIDRLSKISLLPLLYLFWLQAEPIMLRLA